jgi:NAD kinase
LHYGDIVDIQQAAHPMKLIRTMQKDEYFQILRTKLKWGEAVRLPQDG